MTMLFIVFQLVYLGACYLAVLLYLLEICMSTFFGFISRQKKKISDHFWR